MIKILIFLCGMGMLIGLGALVLIYWEIRRTLREIAAHHEEGEY